MDLLENWSNDVDWMDKMPSAYKNRSCPFREDTFFISIVRIYVMDIGSSHIPMCSATGCVTRACFCSATGRVSNARLLSLTSVRAACMQHERTLHFMHGRETRPVMLSTNGRVFHTYRTGFQNSICSKFIVHGCDHEYKMNDITVISFSINNMNIRLSVIPSKD